LVPALPAELMEQLPTSTVPELDGEYLDETRQVWASLWEEEQSSQIIGAQRVVALRWIKAYDQWHRSMKVVEAQPLVDGSQGQPVQNPLMNWVISREVEMEKCEKQLGVGLRNKADLGLTVGQLKITAADLIRMQREGTPNGSNQGTLVVHEDDDGWEAAE